jgi:hypothetical protein
LDKCAFNKVIGINGKIVIFFLINPNDKTTEMLEAHKYESKKSFLFTKITTRNLVLFKPNIINLRKYKRIFRRCFQDWI